MNRNIRARKSLGQHFLTDENVAGKIVSSFLEKNPCKVVLEIGPGLGVLTKYLLNEKSIDLRAVEIDSRMVNHLRGQFSQLENRIIEQDFLQLDIQTITLDSMSIIGNFPYNISSQILFRVLEEKNHIPFVVGMFQKEVARRITSPSGNKEYGLTSVLIQAHYDAEYLFEVGEKCFTPPPKVKSAVIRLMRKESSMLIKDEIFFFKLVKQGFGKRRKTLRNSLMELTADLGISHDPVFDKRAEQLSVGEWIDLANRISESL